MQGVTHCAEFLYAIAESGISQCLTICDINHCKICSKSLLTAFQSLQFICKTASYLPRGCVESDLVECDVVSDIIIKCQHLVIYSILLCISEHAYGLGCTAQCGYRKAWMNHGSISSPSTVPSLYTSPLSISFACSKCC